MMILFLSYYFICSMIAVGYVLNDESEFGEALCLILSSPVSIPVIIGIKLAE